MYLADLSQSLFSALGLSGVDNSLEIAPAERICLVLIDGLGEISLNEFLEKSPGEYRALRSLTSVRSLTSHFPTTTATNLASVGTGSFPSHHAMLGYTVLVPYSDGRILNALKWDERVDPVLWQNVPTLYERAMAEGIQASHIAEKRFDGSGFTRATARGATYLGANRVDDLISQAKLAHRSKPSFSFLYVNWVDHAGHSDGVGSEKWIAALKSVDQLVDRLQNTLSSGTRIYLTSDHGMINAGEKVIIGEGNELALNINHVAGEARARHLYVEEGKLAVVKERWESFFGDRVSLFTREDAEELFAATGTTEVVSTVRERMGDLIAVPSGELVLLDAAIADREGKMVGHHGALTDIERLIPLRTIAL